MQVLEKIPGATSTPKTNVDDVAIQEANEDQHFKSEQEQLGGTLHVC